MDCNAQVGIPETTWLLCVAYMCSAYAETYISLGQSYDDVVATFSFYCFNSAEVSNKYGLVEK